MSHIIVVNKTELTPVSIQLEDAGNYPTEDWLINVSIDHLEGVLFKYWKLNISGDGVVEMDAAEKTAVDTAELSAYATAYLDVLDAQVKSFIEEHYPAHRQRTLTLLKTEARIDGLTNRNAYIQQAWDWITLAIGYYYQMRDAVLAATTLAEVDAIQPDFTALAASDPKVAIEGALAIMD